jgi:hypothetical protein
MRDRDQDREIRITELRKYYQSFTDTALEGIDQVNGIIVDRIPFDRLDASRIKKRLRDVLQEEIGDEIDRLLKP